MRLQTIQRDGKAFQEITGTASVYETPYDMWDWAGPYQEAFPHWVPASAPFEHTTTLTANANAPAKTSR
jgi:hypothetical protein